MLFIIKLTILVPTIFTIAKILLLYREQKNSFTKMNSKIITAISGFLANFADTIGLGGFAVLIASNRNNRICDEKNLPGTLNAQAMLPVMVQSLFFLKFVEIDFITLVSLISATAFGGLIGGSIIVKLNKQSLLKIMSTGFFIMGILILCHQMNLFPVAGNDIMLRSNKLIIAIISMIFIGMLPAAGIGTYAPSQLVLFFLGMSPLIAFPIMSTSSVFVHAAAAYSFIKQKHIAIRESLLLGAAGSVGVLTAAPMLIYINQNVIRWMLFIVVMYNAVNMLRSYLKNKKQLLSNSSL